MGDTSSDQEPTRRLDRKYRLIVGIMVGVSAVVVLSLTVILSLIGTSSGVGASLGAIWLVTILGAGGFISGYLLAGGFGLRGRKGWAIACLAYIGSTIAGGAFGGLFMSLLSGGTDGPLGGLAAGAILAPFVLFMGGGYAFLMWLFSFSIIQLIATRIRRNAPTIEPNIAKRFE